MNNKVISERNRQGNASKAANVLQKTIDENIQLSGDVQELDTEIARLRASLQILKNWNDLPVSTKIKKIGNGEKPDFEKELAKIKIKATSKKAQVDQDDLEVIIKTNKTLKKEKESKEGTVKELDAELKTAKEEAKTPITKLVKKLEAGLADTKADITKLRNRPAQVRIEHVPYSPPEREFKWGESKYSCCEAPVD